ncbi:hypothetical protein [Nonlabens xylanidelens]|uniref:hypothetical protein n=1 Tax=Nonlabens xylanidelens TaxID=191564 RepID=UPI0011B0A97A|nr:hypothetical protein [Nonlabens xylanidelens]
MHYYCTIQYVHIINYKKPCERCSAFAKARKHQTSFIKKANTLQLKTAPLTQHIFFMKSVPD